MPCRDYYDDHPEQYFKDVTEPALKKQISFAESALCATLDALDKIVTEHMPGQATFDQIDFDSAGIIRKELVDWRLRHKELDEYHREYEARKFRETARAKLTLEERAALGIK